jgi:hypothetical protein
MSYTFYYGSRYTLLAAQLGLAPIRPRNGPPDTSRERPPNSACAPSSAFSVYVLSTYAPPVPSMYVSVTARPLQYTALSLYTPFTVYIFNACPLQQLPSQCIFLKYIQSSLMEARLKERMTRTEAEVVWGALHVNMLSSSTNLFRNSYFRSRYSALPR